MELLFNGTEIEEEEILPAWAYTFDEIKNLIEQYIEHTEILFLKENNEKI